MSGSDGAGPGNKVDGGGCLRLPIELRTIIYNELFYPGMIETLQSPPLSQVNRQIREEVAPIYYGESDFSICMPMNNEDLDWFIGELRSFATGGALRYLRRLELVGRGNCSVTDCTFAYDIHFLGQGIPERCISTLTSIQQRIDFEAVDWTDKEAVEAAYHPMFNRLMGLYMHSKMPEEFATISFPTARILEILQILGQHCQEVKTMDMALGIYLGCQNVAKLFPRNIRGSYRRYLNSG